MPNDTKVLRCVRVTTLMHVDSMRQIYNDNLDMLATVSLPYRNPDEQVVWWKESKHHMRAYLFENVDKPSTYIGFITLTDRGEFMTPILAVSKEYWGRGYGSQMIKAYIRLAHKPLAGSQLISNEAIRHMNAKHGWQIVGKADSPGGEIELVYHPGVSRKNPGTEHSKEVVTAYLIDKYQGYAI